MVRVSAQLVDTRTGFRTWSQTYDRRMTDIFAVQQGIAAAVANALRVKLTAAPQTAAAATTNPVAFDDYLRGRQLMNLNGGEAQRRSALALFDAAIAADPGYAVAYAAKARLLVELETAYLRSDALRSKRDAALAAARRAVDLA